MMVWYLNIYSVTYQYCIKKEIEVLVHGKVNVIDQELLWGMPLCGYSVEPSDSMIPCGYKL
jgi:hypothetical protein